MSKGILITIVVIGILLSSIITLTAITDAEAAVELSIGTLLGWIPYVGTLVVARRLKASATINFSLAVGLIVYAPIDLAVHYNALHRPTSSTDPIAIIMVLGLSIVIIPAASAVAYLLIRAGQTLASKTVHR
jgi:hypothetical protein